jgi:DNA-binding HxlR family transcriptional regulator
MRGETIEERYMDILLLILRGKNTSSKISKSLKIPRKTVSNRLTALYKKGYIEKNLVFNSRPYMLTSKGKEGTAIFLSTLKGRSQKDFRQLQAHKVSWSLNITKKPHELNDLLYKNSFTVSRHKNWHKFRKEYEDYKIVFNPNMVYIYFNAFYINDPMEYYDIAIDKVRKIKKELEERFPGLVLGTPDLEMAAESQHIARKHGPLAMKFMEESIKNGKSIVYHGSHLNVDFSEGPPEEETVDKKTAPIDMLSLGNFFNDWIKKPIPVSELHATKDKVEQTAKLQVSLESDYKEDISNINASINSTDNKVKDLDTGIKSEFENLKQQILDISKAQQESQDKLSSSILQVSKAQQESQARLNNSIIETSKTYYESQDKLNKLIYETSKAQQEAQASLSNSIIETSRAQLEAQEENTKVQNQIQDNLIRLNNSQEIFATAMHEHVALIKTLQVLAQKNKEGLENGLERMGNLVKDSFDYLNHELDVRDKEFRKEQVLLLKILAEHTKPWYLKIWHKLKNMRGKKHDEIKDKLRDNTKE